MVDAIRARRPGFFRQAWLITAKDLRIEVATGEVTTTSGFFAVLVAIIASLSFFGGENARLNVAPGVIWIAIAFASIFALSRTWQREREDGALRGLLVMPISRAAIFLGKTTSVAIFIVLVQIIVTPVCALFFDLELSRYGLGLGILYLSATPGVAASGALFGAMTIRTRARDLVLAAVMLPLLSPSLLAGVAGTRVLFDGAPLAELQDYVMINLLFAAIFIVGGLGMFETLIEG